MLWKTDFKPSCSFCDHTVRDRTMELANKNRILLIKQNSFGENDNLFFSFKGEHSRGARTLMHRTNCASLCKHSLPPSLARSLPQNNSVMSKQWLPKAGGVGKDTARAVTYHRI